MEKWKPSERKGKIGENVPSKSLVGIVGLVYLRCPSVEGGRQPVPAGALGQRHKKGWFCKGLRPDLGLELVRFLVHLRHGESASEPGELSPLSLYR